jgi:hypothetical protein
MRLSFLSMLGTVLVGLVCATAGFAQGGVPATKAAASVANNIKLAGCIETVNNGGGCSNNVGDWRPLIDTYINPPGGKDLLITVSMQSGLFDGALTAPAFILETSGLRVKVLDSVDGAPPIVVSPRQVTWDRQLNFALDLANYLYLELESGVRSFTFIERNAPVGVHHIVVKGRYEIAAEEEGTAGILGSFAFVSHRTLTVQQVSLPPETTN